MKTASTPCNQTFCKEPQRLVKLTSCGQAACHHPATARLSGLLKPPQRWKDYQWNRRRRPRHHQLRFLHGGSDEAALLNLLWQGGFIKPWDWRY